MSRNYSEKLKAIRKAEGLTQQQFAELIGISLGTIKNYESSQHEAKALTVEKVLEIEKLQKYTLWLMTDKTAPVAGQVSPVVAHSGPEETTSLPSGRKTG
ncbi:helix-turn-helix domain-containing protein [Citrobacter cronae]|uniref:helix-turn-helix transcriptional regulator n=1 Tax=Citrobacter cronae TaxID=1748967 RepID=UPI0021D36DC6|nr:helix-turn-helix transcriptional regulator [Citrobacter cronae]MCU6182669.1 helix-turn-helix domain-containing protein [Citrobacter cronae]